MTGFAPTDVASLEAWLDGNDSASITDTAGDVTLWADKSGNGHDFAQSTPANSPTVTSSVLNGLQGLVFDGIASRLENLTLNITQPYTVFVIANTDNATGGGRHYVFDGRQNSPGDRSLLALRGDSSNRPSIWAGSWGLHANTTDTAFHVFRCDYNGASSNIGIDGDVDSVNAGSTSNNLDNGMVLGANYLLAGDYLDGAICEVVILVGATSSEKDEIEGYLAWRWGLEANLPSGHPYENAAPVPTRNVRISVPAPLGVPSIVVDQDLGSHDARILVPPPLGIPRVYASNDFSALVVDPTHRYELEITGSPTITLKMSSWQATRQTDRDDFLQAVVPNAGDYIEDLESRQGVEEFVVYRIGTVDGVEVRSEMARATIETLRDSSGPFRDTMVITGFYEIEYEVSSSPEKTLANARQKSQTLGDAARIRADIDWVLRPGQLVTGGGVSLTANYINYYVPAEGDAYMDVGNRG